LDVPGPPDADAAALASQGYAIIAMSGTTASRPNGTAYVKAGVLYIDTTLNAVLVFDGLVWRNVLTGAAA
jgi:hypothetical protein